MSEAGVKAQLAERYRAGRWSTAAIQKQLRLQADYHQTIGFVNAAAWIANGEDHHPELAVAYDYCVVRFSTHSVEAASPSTTSSVQPRLDALID